MQEFIEGNLRLFMEKVELEVAFNALEGITYRLARF